MSEIVTVTCKKLCKTDILQAKAQQPSTFQLEEII